MSLTPEQTKLVEGVIPLAHFIARKMKPPRGMSHEDLAQAGLTHLMIHIDKYVPDGRKFSGFASNAMLWGMQQEQRKEKTATAAGHRVVALPNSKDDGGDDYSLLLSAEDDFEGSLLIEQVIASIPDETDRTIVRMSLNDHTLEQIGTAVGMTKQSVSLRLINLRGHIRAQGISPSGKSEQYKVQSQPKGHRPARVPTTA